MGEFNEWTSNDDFSLSDGLDELGLGVQEEAPVEAPGESDMGFDLLRPFRRFFEHHGVLGVPGVPGPGIPGPDGLGGSGAPPPPPPGLFGWLNPLNWFRHHEDRRFDRRFDRRDRREEHRGRRR